MEQGYRGTKCLQPAVSQLYPTRREVQRPLPVASCCVIPVGNRTFTRFGSVQGEEDCTLRFREYQ